MSRYVGEETLSALNIVYPIPSIIIAVSIMLATGGSAIIAKNMGEGKGEEAKEKFSFIVSVGGIFGVVFLILGVLFIDPLILLLGATPELYANCYDYLFILIISVPMAVFQMLFQNFFVTAGQTESWFSIGRLRWSIKYYFRLCIYQDVQMQSERRCIGDCDRVFCSGDFWLDLFYNEPERSVIFGEACISNKSIDTWLYEVLRKW